MTCIYFICCPCHGIDVIWFVISIMSMYKQRLDERLVKILLQIQTFASE